MYGRGKEGKEGKGREGKGEGRVQVVFNGSFKQRVLMTRGRVLRKGRKAGRKGGMDEERRMVKACSKGK